MSDINLPQPGDEAEAQVMGEQQDIQRKPINEGAPQTQESEFGRKPLGQPRNLDADFYLQKYGADKKLMWVNDIGGDVQRWIDMGAEPVPVENRSGRTFEGITDSHESKWVRAVGGETANGPFWVYLLMVDPEIYDEVQIKPQRERQEAIHQAMHGGRDQSGGAGGELQSYAPNLPTGDRGMNVAQETEQ